MAKIPLGRPQKSTTDEGAVVKEKPSSKNKNITPFQIRLSPDADENNRLKGLYASKMGGRQGFLALLNASDEQWEQIRLILEVS